MVPIFFFIKSNKNVANICTHDARYFYYQVLNNCNSRQLRNIKLCALSYNVFILMNFCLTISQPLWSRDSGNSQQTYRDTIILVLRRRYAATNLATNIILVQLLFWCSTPDLLCKRCFCKINSKFRLKTAESQCFMKLPLKTLLFYLVKMKFSQERSRSPCKIRARLRAVAKA